MGDKKDERRIAFVLGGMSNGGAERVVSLLANYYAKQGKVVDILTLLSKKCTYQLEPNVKIISLANEEKSRKLQVFQWIIGIRRYHKENRPYRIVSFFAKINVVVMIALCRYIGDVVVSERNDPAKDGRGFFCRAITNILYPKTKRVVFQTKWAQSCFNQSVINNSEIVQNPITQISMQNVEKTKTIVNVGKFSDQKNHRLLINAFAQIADAFPKHELVIYGEGAKRQELEAMINGLGLSDRIKLPGWTSEIYKKVATSELFVLSSNYEGFSNALLEAMMIGIPCISTNCAGSNELIADNVNGLLIPVGGLDELVCAMRTMLENPALSAKLAKQGKNDVQKFGVSKIIGRWENVIG